MNFAASTRSRMAGPCCAECARGDASCGMGAMAEVLPVATDPPSCGKAVAIGAGMGAIVGVITGALAGLAAGGEGRRGKGAAYGALVATPLLAAFYGAGTYFTYCRLADKASNASNLYNAIDTNPP